MHIGAHQKTPRRIDDHLLAEVFVSTFRGAGPFIDRDKRTAKWRHDEIEAHVANRLVGMQHQTPGRHILQHQLMQ